MIYGYIKSPSTFLPLRYTQLWIEAFDVLQALGEESPLGITPLRGDKMFLHVHEYSTKKISECRFEGHRNMIDLQYMISGSEIIECADKRKLIADDEYDCYKDIEYFIEPEKIVLTKLHLNAGSFAIFFSEDAHRPQISDGYSDSVFKAVIKIHRDLLK